MFLSKKFLSWQTKNTNFITPTRWFSTPSSEEEGGGFGGWSGCDYRAAISFPSAEGRGIAPIPNT